MRHDRSMISPKYWELWRKRKQAILNSGYCRANDDDEYFLIKTKMSNLKPFSNTSNLHHYTKHPTVKRFPNARA